MVIYQLNSLYGVREGAAIVVGKVVGWLSEATAGRNRVRRRLFIKKGLVLPSYQVQVRWRQIEGHVNAWSF